MSMRSETSCVLIDLMMIFLQVGNDEVTCLMLAVREGHSSIVEILLKAPGIDVT